MESISDIHILELLGGQILEHVSSFEGTGQYTQGGTSTCGLAALNAVRIVLEREKAGIIGPRLLEQIISKDVIEEIVAICARWASQLHLEVDDIAKLPLFDNTLAIIASDYNEAERENFAALLRRLEETSQARGSSAAVVITRPPEIFAVFHILTHTPSQPGIFAFFDSHPRPTRGAKGASFVLFSTLEGASDYISRLLQVDKSLLSGSLQWQAQLLGHYSGHVFLARNSSNLDADRMRSVYDANMEILELQSRLSDAEERIRVLNSENSTLRQRIGRPQEVKSTDEISIRGESYLGQGKSTSRRSSTPIAGPSNHRHVENSSAFPGVSKDSLPQNCSTDSQSYEDAALAHRLARDLDDAESSWEAAMLAQGAFDREDVELRSQMAHLKQGAQRLFECIICFELFPEDYVAQVDACKHRLCRDCMKQFVASKIEEHRYPIVCPICQSNKSTHEPGVITGDLVEQLGLTEAQQAIWIELELSAFSIILDCPRCRRSTFVDLADHTDMKLLMCPLRDCNYVWCKECQRHVEPGNQHSCDGSLELDGLMKSRGWHYCPGCKTPTEKHSGCNHMTCPARGCNTHFCYVCGETIVRSVRQGDVEPALSAHYRRCSLFEDVLGR